MNRRPDASMDLLRSVTEGALEPEYRSTRAPRRTAWVTLVAMTLVAALLTYAVVQTSTNRDVLAAERQALVTELDEAREHQWNLDQRIEELETEIQALRASALPDEGQRAALDSAQLDAGAAAVAGPGVVATADDAEGATGSEGRVLDSDLTILVNGLFEAGAEAVAINGRRITTRTPIRTAGSAVTVDYVSLSPPYRVEAIGDPTSLAGGFGATRAAAWWQHLHSNYGLRIDVTVSDDDLELPADPGLGVRYAKGA